MKSLKEMKEKSPFNKQVFSNPLFQKLPEFNFLGNKEVIIEGSKGVIEYSKESIRVNTALCVVSFSGRNLNLRCISQTELIVDGFITKVEFLV